MDAMKEELMEGEIVRLRERIVSLEAALNSEKLKRRLPALIGWESFEPNGIIASFETLDGVTEFLTEYGLKKKFGEDALDKFVLKRVLNVSVNGPHRPGYREYRRQEPEPLKGGYLFRYREDGLSERDGRDGF